MNSLSRTVDSPESLDEAQIAKAVDAHMTRRFRHYSKILFFVLTGISTLVGWLFNSLVETKLSELTRAREEINRELGRLDEKSRKVDGMLKSIEETQARTAEHEARLTEERKKIDEILSEIKIGHAEASQHVATLRKKSEDAQVMAKRLEDRQQQLADNLQKALQAMQRKNSEMSTAAAAVESQMAQQEAQRKAQVEARRATLLATEGLPGIAHRVVYDRDPKGVSVYLKPTEHVSSDAVAAVRFDESGIVQFHRLQVPEADNDGTPQARVRFTGWVDSSRIDGVDARLLKDNPSQVLLMASGAESALHGEASEESPALLYFKPGKSLPAMATGVVQQGWTQMVIDAWMPVHFSRSVGRKLIAPVQAE